MSSDVLRPLMFDLSASRRDMYRVDAVAKSVLVKQVVEIEVRLISQEKQDARYQKFVVRISTLGTVSFTATAQG